MSDATDFFKGTYITAEKTKSEMFPMKLTIKEVEETEFQGKPKLVLHFDEIDQLFGLNKTNALIIIEHFGKETNNWPGSVITLLKTTTPMDGKDKPCIRVKKKEGA